MATYPNNWRTGVGFNPNYTYFGVMPYFVYNAEIGTGAGSRLNWQIGDQGGGFKRTASAPDGYGMQTPFPPVKAGSISAWNNCIGLLTMTGNMLQGGPMEGTAPVVELTGESGLSLVVSMAGSAAVATLTGNSMVLRLTVGLSGSGSFQLTGENNLALIVPFEGAGSVMTMGVGATDLRGLLSMEGEWTPFTELSPEGLAAAVWNSLVSQYGDAGTMGNALGLASSGGVDYNLLAQAVWEYVSRTLTSGGGAAPEQVAAAILAAAQITPIHSEVKNIEEVSDTILTDSRTLTTSKFMGLK